MDNADIFWVFHSATAEYTFYSAAHGTFSKSDHFLGHKASLSTCKKLKKTPYIPSAQISVRSRSTPCISLHLFIVPVVQVHRKGNV
jgi:hypothetical protein